jgi:excisionase family DNA binding protein
MNIPIEDLVQSNRAILQKLDDLEKIINDRPLKKYSPQEIAENTPLGIQTIWSAIKDGRIKAEKFGRKYLISKDEFERVCKEAKSLKYKRTA